jgi:hypothetical protein
MNSVTAKPTAPRITPAELFCADHAFATSLLLATVDVLGLECRGDEETGRPPWDPATVALELGDRLNVVIEDENFSKLSAVWNLLESDDFYHRLPVFVEVIGGLAGKPSWGIPTVAELTWGVFEANIICPPDTKEEGPIFSIEIETYIQKSAEFFGYTLLPRLLREATPQIPQDDPVGFLTEDPEMYASVMSVQTQERDQLDQALLMEVRRLIQQLRRLDLKDRAGLDAYLDSLQKAIR